jgi:hypothetical protein
MPKKIADNLKWNINVLKEEAVGIVEQDLILKQANAIFERISIMEPEDRFLGERCDGTTSFLRSIFRLQSKHDMDDLNLLQVKSILSFCVLNGMETNVLWVAKWENPPTSHWKKVMGTVPGTIPFHNHLKEEEAKEILFHLFGLSAVKTPSPPHGSKRRRSRSPSPSRGRSRSTSRARARARSLSASRGRSRSTSRARARSNPRASGSGDEDELLFEEYEDFLDFKAAKREAESGGGGGDYEEVP